MITEVGIQACLKVRRQLGARSALVTEPSEAARGFLEGVMRSKLCPGSRKESVTHANTSDTCHHKSTGFAVTRVNTTTATQMHAEHEYHTMGCRDSYVTCHSSSCMLLSVGSRATSCCHIVLLLPETAVNEKWMRAMHSLPSRGTQQLANRTQRVKGHKCRQLSQLPINLEGGAPLHCHQTGPARLAHLASVHEWRRGCVS